LSDDIDHPSFPAAEFARNARMSQLIRTQFNVLKALTIHNLQGQMSGYKYGFAWLILEPLVFIAGFRLARKFFGGLASPAGMTPLMFYVLGVFPIYLCFAGIKTFTIPASRSKLLAFPRVTELDLTLAAILASFAIYFLLFWLVAVGVSNYENVWPPQNILEIMLALMGSLIIGTAVGLFFSGLVRVFPPMKQFVGYLNFAVRMASGMFFCITMIPITVWPYLTWNPVLHLTEMTRDAWFESYVSPIASPAYVAECALGLLLLGLLVERYMRRIPKV
jgi:capsular polysaccharide transport system permease protein